MKQKKLSRVRNCIILAIILIFLFSFFLFFKFKEPLRIGLSQTNITTTTTTTRPFQENVSIEMPEGVTRIEKGGRIKIV
jgi:hypothetical protein